MSTPSLELRGIRKSYQTHSTPHLVLDDLDFTLMRGERLGICGLNGAGKTTLINIIAGNLTPDKGKVVRHSRISWPLGYSGGFHGALTGLENVRFIARIYGRNVREAAEFTEDFAELGKFFHMPLRTYSSGMRSRLAFAVSMAVDFELYLIDELMSAGDLRFHEKCRQAIEARRNHADFLIVSHSLSTIEDNCNRFAVLNAGKLISYDSFDTALEAYSEIYGQGQKERKTDWTLAPSGLVEARGVAQTGDTLEVVLHAQGAGHLIAYWGKATDTVAAEGDRIALECPVQVVADSVAEIVPEWTGVQLVERDRAGGALVSDVDPKDFLNGLPQMVITETRIKNPQTRHFQLGIRIEMAGQGEIRLRLGRPFLDRQRAARTTQEQGLN